MKSGLVSITFRHMSPQAIIGLAVKANLSCIEWGGDVHVPHGDIRTARQVSALTEDAGLQVCSYGSYYRAGEPVSANNPAFDAVLDTALALKAKTIRIWAGSKASAAASEVYTEQVITDSRRLAGLAAAANIDLAFEFHGNTLTDTAKSACDLLGAIDRFNVFTYWQPPVGSSVADNLLDIEKLSPWLYNIHIFHWQTDKNTPESPEIIRLPLADGYRNWQRYLNSLAKSANKVRITPQNRCALLEFVKDDSPQQLLADAKILQSLLHGQTES